MDYYMSNGYPGSTNGSGTARGNKGDINYDIRKTLNAKLEGNQGKTFLRRIPDQQKPQILRIIQRLFWMELKQALLILLFTIYLKHSEYLANI